MNRWVFVCACLLMAGCDRGQSPQGEVDPRPKELASTVMGSIGSSCFLEKINHVAVRARSKPLTGRQAVFSGWASVADAEHPSPEWVHLVLRPASAGAETKNDVYLKMGRMPRPDLAVNDARREMVGFEGEAGLPGAGSYQVLVSQSNGRWQTLCPTGSVVEVGQ